MTTTSPALATALVLLLGLWILPACGSATGPSVSTSASTTSTAQSNTGPGGAHGRARLTFREVEQTLAPTGNPPTTPPDQITATGTVVVDQRDQTTNQVVQRYQLGPVLLNGTIIKNATAVLGSTGQWQVNFTTTSAGSGAFDAMAAKEYQKAVAIVLDNNVVSAPVIQATAFHGQGQITGSFTEDQAKNLALVLNSPS